VNRRVCYWCAKYEARSNLDVAPTCMDCAKVFNIPMPTICEPVIEPTVETKGCEVNPYAWGPNLGSMYGQYGQD
jgi:hypothetical protein